jgi:hypothetical protein
MKNPPDSPKSKEGRAIAPKPPRLPILPTVFMRGPALQEQIRNPSSPQLISASFSTLSEEIAKKTAGLREALHGQKYSPIRASPYTLAEAECVLTQAECLLAALPGDISSVPADISKERLCRAVDVALMLDAAIRALQSP